MSLNRVSLIGHVGNAPRFYQTDEGDTYACFSLATQQSWKDSTGQRQTRTQWHPVVVFSQGLVEITRRHVGKGAYVFVEGKLNHRKTLTDDGREQIVTEVLLKDYHGMIRVLNKGKEASAVSNIQHDDGRFNQNTVEVV